MRTQLNTAKHEYLESTKHDNARPIWYSSFGEIFKHIMRSPIFGLLGDTNFWQMYAKPLKTVPRAQFWTQFKTASGAKTEDKFTGQFLLNGEIKITPLVPHIVLLEIRIILKNEHNRCTLEDVIGKNRYPTKWPNKLNKFNIWISEDFRAKVLYLRNIKYYIKCKWGHFPLSEVSKTLTFVG